MSTEEDIFFSASTDNSVRCWDAYQVRENYQLKPGWKLGQEASNAHPIPMLLPGHQRARKPRDGELAPDLKMTEVGSMVCTVRVTQWVVAIVKCRSDTHSRYSDSHAPIRSFFTDHVHARRVGAQLHRDGLRERNPVFVARGRGEQVTLMCPLPCPCNACSTSQ